MEDNQNSNSPNVDPYFTTKAIIFLGGVTAFSTMAGFGSAFVSAKKQDPKFFNEGLVKSAALQESGSALALRALGWGSVYAITGCGLICYSIWKLSGAKNMEEFRYKMQRILPRISKGEPP